MADILHHDSNNWYSTIWMKRKMKYMYCIIRIVHVLYCACTCSYYYCLMCICVGTSLIRTLLNKNTSQSYYSRIIAIIFLKFRNSWNMYPSKIRPIYGNYVHSLYSLNHSSSWKLIKPNFQVRLNTTFIIFILCSLSYYTISITRHPLPFSNPSMHSHVPLFLVGYLCRHYISIIVLWWWWWSIVE